MPDQHSNFAVSTVATAPSPATSGTSLSVASGEGSRFPAVPFNATVRPANAPPDPSNAEIIRVTARSTDSFGTIARAQEGSSARAIQVGDHISATVTAKSLTDIEGDVTAAFSEWRDLGFQFGTWAVAGGTAANTYVLRINNADVLAAASSALGVAYLDPADFSAGSRTTQVRLRGWVITNAVAPAVTFTFGLYPVATTGGASGAFPSTATVGSVVGATAAITSPAATSVNHVETAAAAFPAAGFYVVTVVTSGSTAANSHLGVTARLQMRQV